jgi:HEPN domain-containing protein
VNEFTKTKIHFALALLGTLFALHPFLQKFEDRGFVYLDYELKLVYAYIGMAGLLAVCVYCFGLTLVSERPHSWLEKLGNYSYALAIVIGPLYGALYVSSLAADRIGQSHLAWSAPAVALGAGIGWLVLSQVVAFMVRGRLGRQDQAAKLEQLAALEVTSIDQAHELFTSQHYDLSVIEIWRALEARLRRALLAKGISPRNAAPEALIQLASRARLVREPSLGLLKELRAAWNIAISSEPLSREAADKALGAARIIFASIPLAPSSKDASVKPALK